MVMTAIKAMAKSYAHFTQKVRDKIRELQLAGYHAVRPTWVSDHAPFRAYIQGCKGDEKVKIRVETGAKGTPVLFIKERSA